ncbi:hypothetical protein OJ998_07310 [Solirubrobacter taibaiensis]|nr:hypothetical protein [Solirubrobacter taibaiensis]
MTVPIDIAPLSRTRRGAVRAQHALALLIVAAVVLQVYLIGAYIFGAGADALEAHRGVGFTTHMLEVLTIVPALLARRDRLLALALGVLGTVQLALVDGDGWVGGLHPLFAMVVLALAFTLARRSR